jgi:glycosyltransferase involved in cell wall biosynthesis
MADLRVALNLVFLVPGETGGMETYARELIAAMAELADLDPVALVNRETAGQQLGCEQLVVPVRARNRVEWVRGEQQHVPRLAERVGAHLLHSLASTAPLWGRVPRVTTVHDLNFKLVPDTHFGLRGLGMRALVPAAARRSRRIIVDATSTREDLVRHLGLDAAKVDVVPLAAAGPAAQRAAGDTIRAELGLGSGPIILSPSAKRPHKNLMRLLEGLARVPDPDRPVLVLPGYRTAHEDELRARAAELGVADRVAFPGWLHAEKLEGLYRAASCVVFPSLYEGFGLPVLEAMVRGVPVACSNRSSLPEVAGDAALLFDPEDPAAIANAIRRLLGDAALAARLAVRGRKRATAYTWERTARLTRESYERALAES